MSTTTTEPLTTERSAVTRNRTRSRSAAAHFPADRQSPHRARAFLTEQLGTWGCTERRDVAVLLVSELVTNGVLHAGTPVGVAAGFDGDTLAVAVTDGVPGGIDGGPWPDRHPRGAPSGRGLRIVDSLADDWGVSVHDQGKTVWFELGPAASGTTEPTG